MCLPVINKLEPDKVYEQLLFRSSASGRAGLSLREGNKAFHVPSLLPEGSFQDGDQGDDLVMAAVTRTTWMVGFVNKSFFLLVLKPGTSDPRPGSLKTWF